MLTVTGSAAAVATRVLLSISPSGSMKHGSEKLGARQDGRFSQRGFKTVTDLVTY